MSRLTTAVLVIGLLLVCAGPSSAYLWRCHSPNGDFWTSEPKESDDCEEYDSIYNPSAAPPKAQQRTSAQFTTPERQGKDKLLFTQQELDQMLSPIALYPDSLLSQILMASTYPLEIVEATRWAKANQGLQGDQAVKATEQKGWEPSVKSLVAFPNILAMMDEKLDWTERLGDAFLSQQTQVMDTVQNLRQRASATGNLQSTDQIRVEQQGQNIVIESPNPQVVYVPYYDPAVIYGPWWWPSYPPIYWGPWPGYFIGPRFGVGFVWGPGITVGASFFFGAFDWPHRQVNVMTVNNYYYRNSITKAWTHDPIHRRGVPYRAAALRQQFGRTSASPEMRQGFRGHFPSSFVGHGGFGNRLDTRGSLENRLGPSSRPRVPAGSGFRSGEPRPHAFEGIGHGAYAHNFSARGRTSFPRGGSGGGGFHRGR
jgi:uncharacterized protein DUF3300